MMTRICLPIAILLIALSLVDASLLPPSFLDCVVAIGRKDQIPGSQIQGPWMAEASGFLYGKFLSKVNDTQSVYVIEDHLASTNAPIWVKFNLQTSTASREYEVPLVDAKGEPSWHPHPNRAVDLVVVPINAQFLRSEGARFTYFRSDVDFLSRAKAKEIGLSEGDGIYVLGFPLGLVGQSQEYVVVRQGSVARIRDTLDSPSTVTTFLIDSFVFPGSSGSPVVSKPELVSVAGTKAIGQAYLLGVVAGFKPYTDVAISLQTKRPRVTFEENSGLAEVVPADYIEETIQNYEKSLRK